MSRFVRRRLFERIVFWQPASGTIIDLPSRFALSFEGPSNSEEYVQLTDGTERPVRRTSQVQVPVVARELALMGDIFQSLNCPVHAAFIGGPKADSWMWLEDTRLNVTDPAVSSGLQVEKVLNLTSHIYYPAIWEGMDLLEGVPWQGTEAVNPNDNLAKDLQIDGVSLVRTGSGSRPGYKGPLWTAGENATVDLAGNASNLTSLSQAIIEIEFPVWYSTLELKSVEGYGLTNARIQAVNWDGTAIQTSTGELQIPKNTWSVRCILDDANARPRLLVKNTGENKARVYAGGVTPDCSRVSDPNWKELPDPNVPPVWEKRGNVCIDQTNNPPTFEQKEDLCWITDASQTTDNVKPVWEDKGNVCWEGLTEPPSEGAQVTYDDTKNLFTADGGFARINWDSLRMTLYPDIGNGQIAADDNAGFVFLATSSGVTRAELIAPSTNQTDIFNGQEVVGIDVDQSTRTIYVSHENKDGIWQMAYDGSNYQEVGSIEDRNLALSVVSAANEGYIFAASGDNSTLKRYNLDGSGELTIDTTPGITRNVNVHVASDLVYFEVRSGTRVDYIARKFDGSSTNNSIAIAVSSGTPPNPAWTVLQKERKLIFVQQVEGFSNASVNTAELDFDGQFTSIGPTSQADTGAYITAQASLNVPSNTSPEFEQKDSLEYTA